MKIAAEVIADWNRLHGESRGAAVRHQHWSTDTYPDARDTGQGAVNRQIIDAAHILVAIFWSRLGTPTAVAESGTVEEIRLGIAGGKYVLIYFSDLESVAADVDAEQKERLWRFRQSVREGNSCAMFQSRTQFRKTFTTHLALALNTLLLADSGRKTRSKKPPRVSQVNRGSGNVQIVGDSNQVNHYPSPPTIRNVIERRPGSVTSEEEHQLAQWIKELAEGTVGKDRPAAFSKWGGHFLARFKLGNRGALLSSQMSDAAQWVREQKALQLEGCKTKDPERWRNARIKAIKAGLRRLNRTEDEYYPEISARLNLRKAFVSLKNVTKADLERIYRLVRIDCASK